MHYSFKSTPTWTFKSRNQLTTKSNQASSRPGPSDYIVKKPLPQTATISSTKQKRQLWKPFQPNPGPGTYQSKSYITAGQKRSMSARYLDHTKATPGPHQYDNDTLKVKSKRPHFTMGTRSKSYKQLTTQKNMYQPAPTAYDSFKGSFVKNTKTVIGTSNRKDLTQTQKTPAPNYYMTEKADQFASKRNARTAIGQQFRNTAFGQGQVTPGPAAYGKKSFVELNKDKNNGYSCRNKTIDLITLQLSKIPGPGAYQSHLGNKNKSARFAPPNTLRKTFMDDMQDFKKSYPGPGQHDPQFKGTKYRSASAYNFGRANRKDLYENQKTPGPNEYKNDKINQLHKSPGYSVGKTIPKNEFLQVNPQLPGPGQYDPNLSLVKSKSKDYGIGKQVRPDFQKQKYTPGPGFYNLRGKQAGPTWKIGTEKRIAFTDNKSQAKNGTIYDIAGNVANPPKYMNVNSKISYSKQKLLGNQSTGFSRKK